MDRLLQAYQAPVRRAVEPEPERNAVLNDGGGGGASLH